MQCACDTSDKENIHVCPTHARITELEALNKKFALAIHAGDEAFDGDEWDKLMATATTIATS